MVRRSRSLVGKIRIYIYKTTVHHKQFCLRNPMIQRAETPISQGRKEEALSKPPIEEQKVAQVLSTVATIATSRAAALADTAIASLGCDE